MSIIKGLVKSTGNEYAKLFSEVEDPKEFYSTGSYTLNGLISTSIFGGVPDNKVITFGGASTTGKSYLMWNVVEDFLKKHENSVVFVYESEDATTKKDVENRNLDSNRIVKLPVHTVQDFRNQALKLVNNYAKLSKEDKEKNKIMVCLDSLGQLSTNKEVGDIEEGKDTVDFTKAKLVRGAFRAIRMPYSHNHIPIIVLNHVYSQMDQYSEDKLSGGDGAYYASDIIITLRKRKEKDEKNKKKIIGNIINCKNFKNRMAIENLQVETKILYGTGIDKYHGLLDLAEESGIVKKLSRQYEVNGEKFYGKEIYKNPEKFFTNEVLNFIDEYVRNNFAYSKRNEESLNMNEEDEGEKDNE